MYHVYTACNFRLTVSSGISAEILESISSGLILPTNLTKMFVYGWPRVCHSTKYIQQRTWPYTLCFMKKFMKDFNFWLKTLIVMSCLSSGVWLCINAVLISEHYGLLLNVTNKAIMPSIWHSTLSIFVHVAHASYASGWQSCQSSHIIYVA